VSPLVVAEVDYMLSSRLGRAAASRFASDIASEAYELAEWNAAVYAIAVGVMDRFSEPRDYIGVADAANVVLADHYRTTDLLTLDRRHFRKLRPLWGADHFTLLPYDRS
jgi:predicted nucleic acid-binding protein